jgi:Asp-tRNA(Asn)/Glu-tRNA(Gln) amidotransferase A subunit family amidase
MVPLLRSAGALLSPTAAGTAPAGLDFTGDPWFCAPWSSIGTPAVSLPNGTGADDLPHAVQLVGPPGGDGELIGLAGWCERVLDAVAVEGR